MITTNLYIKCETIKNNEAKEVVEINARSGKEMCEINTN